MQGSASEVSETTFSLQALENLREMCESVPVMVKRGWRPAVLSCFAFSSAIIFMAGARTAPRQDRSWKRYHNQQWGYCISYPVRWRKGDAFEGAGIFVETGVKKLSNPLGEMDVAALADGSQQPQTSLIQTVQLHLDGLKKFQRAEQIETLEQRPMQLLGSSALFAKERYYDPLGRARWVEEIVFTERPNVLYRLELVCRADQLTRFEPVFDEFVKTFQFDCAEK